MTSNQFEADCARDIAAMQATTPYKAIVRNAHGETRTVTVEGVDVHDAAHRAQEFGEIAALWVAR